MPSLERSEEADAETEKTRPSRKKQGRLGAPTDFDDIVDREHEEAERR
jgi:hypothetical protein